MKHKYSVGDKVVIRNDRSLGEFNGAEVIIESQETSINYSCYRVSTLGDNPITDVLWEGHISGASTGADRPAILEVMNHAQLIRSGLGTVVSDEYGHTWVRIAGGKWAGGNKEDLQILTTKGLWDKFMELELRKEGL